MLKTVAIQKMFYSHVLNQVRGLIFYKFFLSRLLDAIYRMKVTDELINFPPANYHSGKYYTNKFY